MNLTLLSLVRTLSFSSSPFLTFSSTHQHQNTAFHRLHFSSSFTPFFHSISPFTHYRLTSSTFNRYLSQVAILHSLPIGTEVHLQLSLSQEFSLELSECAFTNIITTSKFGAAFYAISDLHTLHAVETRFVNCTSTAKGRIGHRLTSVGGGAFVFSGARSIVERCIFVRCKATFNTQTVHTYVLTDGKNQITNSLFFRNGAGHLTSHTLFSLDNGAAGLSENNITHNNVPGGYAGGHIGWFSQSSKIQFSSFIHNVGKSIFGSCAYSSENSGTDIMWIVVFRNYATKYGIVVRHTGSLSLINAYFFRNIGAAFYGNAPLSLQRSFFDCQRPTGPINEDTVAWNYAIKPDLPLLKVPAVPNDLEDETKAKEGDVESTFVKEAKAIKEAELIRKMFKRKQKLAQPTTVALRDVLKDSSLPRKKNGPRKNTHVKSNDQGESVKNPKHPPVVVDSKEQGVIGNIDRSHVKSNDQVESVTNPKHVVVDSNDQGDKRPRIERKS